MHATHLKRRREKYAESKKTRTSSMENRIKRFKDSIMEGPYYICIVCNRCLYKRYVVAFRSDAYNSPSDTFYFSHTKSFNGSEYVCQTCHRKLKAKKISCLVKPFVTNLKFLICHGIYRILID